MSWQGILGHDSVQQKFQMAAARGRLSGTFLFVGPAGIGKRTFALKLAQALLCERNPESELNPCGSCSACVQVTARTHPDVELVGRPEDKSFIPLELLIGDDEHRLRSGLCYNLSAKPFSGRRKIAIIDDADYLNKEGANCLLKTLEEPPPKALLILIGTSEQRQLPTIRSRCRIIRFQPLSDADLAAVLREHRLVEQPQAIESAILLGPGSVTACLRWLDEDLAAFRTTLQNHLAKGEFDQLELGKLVLEFVDAAGKEAPAKRRRLHEVLEVAEEFYRGLIRILAGATASEEPQLAAALATAARRFPDDLEALTLCLERTLTAQGQIDANASPTNIVEAWLDDLLQVLREGYLPV